MKALAVNLIGPVALFSWTKYLLHDFREVLISRDLC